ncbi:MAG: hypothetical protein ACJA2Q_000127 [Pseudohongiellaceae bacterium]|jgi:hypothetical protein
MSCPKTEHLTKEYFSSDLSEVSKQEMESHLRRCDTCNQELESLLLVQKNLESWQDQRVPHWDRVMELYRREHRSNEAQGRVFDIWRWLPTAASLAMMLLVVLNTSLVISDQGVSISFGDLSPIAGLESDVDIESRFESFQQNQQAVLADFVIRIENRQDSNNMQLMQVVFDQTQQTTAENLERIYAFFEEQRLQDLEDMRVGYQELANNDYETIRSLEQLAQYVSFSGKVQ